MAVLYPFSECVRRLLSQPPDPGSTHRWLAQVAGGLRSVLSKEACVRFLRECCDSMVCHREVTDREISGAVALAYGSEVHTGSGVNQALAWPEMDGNVIRKVFSEDMSHSSLVIGGKSALVEGVDPQGTAGPTISAAEALMTVFKPGELVCAGLDSSRPEIRPLEEWADDAERMQFICVNPMRGMWGTNLKGEPSKRCQSNVRLRRHVVAEFDDPEMDKGIQWKLLSFLSGMAPLVLVVDSGGKSLHGWFRVEEMSAKDQARFFAMACVLGADRTRWDVCGWLRMPGGTRQCRVGDGRSSFAKATADKSEMGVRGKRQRILFSASLERMEHGARNMEKLPASAEATAWRTSCGGDV